MKEIILKVQPCGNNKFRLGISACDSRYIFKKRGFEVCLQLETIFFKTKTKCGPPDDNFNCAKCKKGYDLYDIRIYNWIISHCFHRYKPRKPTKLKFKYFEKSKKLVFVEVKTSMN
jgi:hypothetical protein